MNNAGTNAAYGPLIDLDHAAFVRTLDINLWAPLHWSALAWNVWMGEHGGAIVNTASLGGIVVGERLGAYNISKAALLHATRQLALEMAPRVRVNAVAPGVIKTRFAEALWRDREAAISDVTPLGRIGTPQDIGAAVAFLVSDAASWITGHTLIIDGGQMLRSGVGGDRPGGAPTQAIRIGPDQQRA